MKSKNGVAAINSDKVGKTFFFLKKERNLSTKPDLNVLEVAFLKITFCNHYDIAEKGPGKTRGRGPQHC